jgi:hypothetical protein
LVPSAVRGLRRSLGDSFVEERAGARARVEVQMTHTAAPPEYHPHPNESQVKVASGLNVFAGLYLLLSSLINRVNGGNQANGVVVGFIVVVLAATRLWGKAGPWTGWIEAVIGIWVILAPWVYGYAGAAWMWNAIVVGVVMVGLGIWSATATTTEDAMGRRRV